MLPYELMEKRVNIDGEVMPVYDVRMLLDEMEENIPWKIHLHIAHSGAKGLSYLHSKNIINPQGCKSSQLLPLWGTR